MVSVQTYIQLILGKQMVGFISEK